MGNLQLNRHKDAEALGLYDLLSQFETERERYKANVFIYPPVIYDALLAAITLTRQQIKVFEASAQSEAIDNQLAHNSKLNKAVEMEWSA